MPKLKATEHYDRIEAFADRWREIYGDRMSTIAAIPQQIKGESLFLSIEDVEQMVYLISQTRPKKRTIIVQRRGKKR